MQSNLSPALVGLVGVLSILVTPALAEPVPGQPLAAHVLRVRDALETLGQPLPESTKAQLSVPLRTLDATGIQQALDTQVVARVQITSDDERGLMLTATGTDDPVTLQQHGYTAVLVKIDNQAGIRGRMAFGSPQAGKPYAGVAPLSMRRQQQEALRENENTEGRSPQARFLEVELHDQPPMHSRLSGLGVEYLVVLLLSSEAGERQVLLDVGLEAADPPTAARVQIPAVIRPAREVALTIRDESQEPTIARLEFTDAQGRIYPPQAKRLAPDLFFQTQVYRADGETVLLPPGQFTMQSSRGPEYVVESREITIPEQGPAELEIQLKRWIAPMAFGYFGGDHHIHAAGCAHYTSPTQGVMPEDMFRQVKGEGLNVGCVLTWGPCFDFQRQFFEPDAHTISDDHTLLKYDLEISGFGSQALGHVCLLNLANQTYPGSEGTSTKGWPTWTTPVMRWAKKQGAVTGYAHSASGLLIDPEAASRRLLARGDADGDGALDADEARALLLPYPFEQLTPDGSDRIGLAELVAAHRKADDQLPNYAIPEMNGVGAMEICVSCAEGVCDFISAMDTARIQEWNCWYHLLNCGFPLKVSGETDFPCMSGRNVGQGRVYVKVPEAGRSGNRLSFDRWCEALAAGRSYVSDGYAHAPEFTVNGVAPGDGPIELARTNAPRELTVKARVAFAPRTPVAIAHGTADQADAPDATTPVPASIVGDTVVLHGPRREEWTEGGERIVELIVNGQPVAKQRVPADGQLHDLEFQVRIDRSSWIALRQFPQLHTNPVTVLVEGEPIRASRRSAQWCIDMTKLVWKNRERFIRESERDEARDTFQRALNQFARIAAESPAL